MWQLGEFVEKLEHLEQQYHDDNAWVSWWSHRDVLNCWRMYNTSKRPSTGFLLLGDTKIRSSVELLMNFGTATAHDIQEEEEREVVAALTRRRAAMGTPAIQYDQVKGTGSILSDDKWTPMLNDSFMLGGIHKGLEFHLAENLFHANTLHMQGMTAAEKWRYFFQTNPMSFWDNRYGIPRVFARECIGLKTAGYRPFFSDYSLIFHGPAASTQFDFAQYLAAINTAGLTANNKAAAMEAISDFLFGDRDAIRDTAFPAQY